MGNHPQKEYRGAPQPASFIPKGSRHSGAPLQGFLFYKKWNPMAVPWAASGLPRWGADANPGSPTDATPPRTRIEQQRLTGDCSTPAACYPPRTRIEQPPLPTPLARGNVITNSPFRRTPRGDFITSRPFRRPVWGTLLPAHGNAMGQTFLKRLRPARAPQTFRALAKGGIIMGRPLEGFRLYNGSIPWRCHGQRVVCTSGANTFRLSFRGRISPPVRCAQAAARLAIGSQEMDSRPSFYVRAPKDLRTPGH